MHPTIAEQLANDTQRDRLAAASRVRLARQARVQPDAAEASDQRSIVRAAGPRLHDIAVSAAFYSFASVFERFRRTIADLRLL